MMIEWKKVKCSELVAGDTFVVGDVNDEDMAKYVDETNKNPDGRAVRVWLYTGAIFNKDEQDVVVRKLTITPSV